MLKTVNRLAVCLGILAGAAAGILAGEEIRKREGRITGDYKKRFLILNEWIAVKQRGGSVLEYLALNGYRRIALIGSGELAERFYEELLDGGYTVLWEKDSKRGTVNPDDVDAAVLADAEPDERLPVPAITLESAILGAWE